MIKSKYGVGDRLVCISPFHSDLGITFGRIYMIIKNNAYNTIPFMYVRNDNGIVQEYVSNYFITEMQYLDGFMDNIKKSVSYIPDAIMKFNNMFAVIMFQVEYGVWNSDGSFNPGRFNIFKEDYDKFLHKEYRDEWYRDNRVIE